MEMHLLRWIRQIRLHQRIIQKPRDSMQDELKVLVPVYPRQVVDEEIIRRLILRTHRSYKNSTTNVHFPYILTINRAHRRRVVVQGDDQDLQRAFDERLQRVAEQQVIVRHAQADRIVRADRVQERREHRQSMAILRRSQVPGNESLKFCVEFAPGAVYMIHLLGFCAMSLGGWYMVSLKQVRISLSSSVRFESKAGLRGGECAKPTPASQMYSQLSMADSSSALSYKNVI